MQSQGSKSAPSDFSLQVIAVPSCELFKGLVVKSCHLVYPDLNEYLRVRSKECGLFSIPRFKTVNFGRHSIRYLGPVLWSKLGPEVRQSETLHSFKNRIRQINLGALLDGQCHCTLCDSLF